MNRLLGWKLGFLLGVLGIVGGGTMAQATTVKSFAFEGICETAQTIVHVQCLARESVTFPNRDGIYTQTRFRVLEVIKGQADAELVLTLPGGHLAGRHMQVPGMPQFSPDEETVLFLSVPDEFGSPWPVGLGQGCYGVKVKEGDNRQVNLRAGHTPLPAGLRSKPIVDSQMELRDFIATVQGVLNISQSDSDKKQ